MRDTRDTHPRSSMTPRGDTHLADVGARLDETLAYKSVERRDGRISVVLRRPDRGVDVAHEFDVRGIGPTERNPWMSWDNWLGTEIESSFPLDLETLALVTTGRKLCGHTLRLSRPLASWAWRSGYEVRAVGIRYARSFLSYACYDVGPRVALDSAATLRALTAYLDPLDEPKSVVSARTRMWERIGALTPVAAIAVLRAYEHRARRAAIGRRPLDYRKNPADAVCERDVGILVTFPFKGLVLGYPPESTYSAIKGFYSDGDWRARARIEVPFGRECENESERS